MMIKKPFLVYFLLIVLMLGCQKDSPDVLPASSYELEIPSLFKEKLIAPVIPADNPLTVEGIALGKRLFFDPILSSNGRLACAHCHLPENGFSDTRDFSLGVRGQIGDRNAMPLFNLAWNYEDRFGWDGKALGLENQALIPVTHPKEMSNRWEQVAETLKGTSIYPPLFEAAFGSEQIDSIQITKALAQFERTLISANAPFDQYLIGEIQLSPAAQNGFQVFMDENRGDCFHCHGGENNPLWTDNTFHNNGLDQDFSDLGLGAVTGDPADNGKFKTPSLRNLTRTPPYMHDGRFQTLEEVIDHYSEGLQPSATIDPLMKKVAQGGVQLSAKDKADLLAFLKTLTDPEFGRSFSREVK